MVQTLDLTAADEHIAVRRVASPRDRSDAPRAVERRVCPLCGHPIRGGQRIAHVHGSTVHAACRPERAAA